MEYYEDETRKLLRRLGVNGSYMGFGYTVYGITQTIQNPDLIIYICKGLYTEIAIHYHVSVCNVERNIRTVINTIWKEGDRRLLNQIFHRELKEKPKNTAFIDVLSQYVLESSYDIAE